MVKKELQKLDRQNKRWNNILENMLEDIFNIYDAIILKVENEYKEDEDIEGACITYINRNDCIGIESIFVPYGQISYYKLFQFKE